MVGVKVDEYEYKYKCSYMCITMIWKPAMVMKGNSKRKSISSIIVAVLWINHPEGDIGIHLQWVARYRMQYKNRQTWMYASLCYHNIKKKVITLILQIWYLGNISEFVPWLARDNGTFKEFNNFFEKNVTSVQKNE